MGVDVIPIVFENAGDDHHSFERGDIETLSTRSVNAAQTRACEQELLRFGYNSNNLRKCSGDRDVGRWAWVFEVCTDYSIIDFSNAIVPPVWVEKLRDRCKNTLQRSSSKTIQDNDTNMGVDKRHAENLCLFLDLCAQHQASLVFFD